MSSHEDGTRGLWEPVVLTPTNTGNNETIPVCIHGLNARGQEEVLPSWYRVTRAALLSSPSAALASLDRSNQVEEEVLQRNGISVDEYMEDEDMEEEDEEDEEEEEEDGVCGASVESIEGLEKVRVEKGLMGLENSCPICLDEFEIWSEATKMPCNHFFHSNCIEMWLEKSNVCPLCRYKMPQS
ncbi:E3 ubiquitin-protein ligase [Tripterygium wilfordii]|uniref:RING-type E3 ubiquitin transferase n=1 Tax=Tripterygium wilfordii TaxID=458696 RepID=A0A7J7D030_TRIWF|nr:E3 ubiquitin-protein ligase RZF1-like [Tripterygium wilfordii]KAF5739722.1 E3 ubiquitin-protein ligase [Tripterygium wilfordii]